MFTAASDKSLFAHWSGCVQAPRYWKVIVGLLSDCSRVEGTNTSASGEALTAPLCHILNETFVEWHLVRCENVQKSVDSSFFWDTTWSEFRNQHRFERVPPQVTSSLWICARPPRSVSTSSVSESLSTFKMKCSCNTLWTSKFQFMKMQIQVFKFRTCWNKFLPTADVLSDILTRGTGSPTPANEIWGREKVLNVKPL